MKKLRKKKRGRIVAKKVSVIIPTYNRKKELIQSIKTVLNQTYPGEIEIIIIDDSKESFKPTIDKEFSSVLNKEKNREIIYVHNAKKQGAPLARNLGIKKAKGEYLAFLDDDDEWMPEKTEKQVKIMEKEKDVGLVICYSLDKRFGKERISKPPIDITHKMIIKSFNLSSTSSYLVRKKVLEELGGFDVSLPSAQEYDLAIRLSKKYMVRCVPEVLMIQNETDGQISQNWTRKIKGIMALYAKYNNEYGLIDQVKTIGLIGMFSLGFLAGDRIYNFLIPIKKLYEGN